MMKNIFILLALAFLLVSCDNDTVEETNPFVGTWEREDVSDRWVFTDTTVAVLNKTNGTIYWSGTYDYDDENITFYYEYRVPGLEANPNPQTYTYSIENNTLLLGGRVRVVKV